MVEIQDKERYFELIKDFEFVPFTQTRGWYDYNACIKPDSIRCFVDHETQPQIACFGHEKRFLGLTMLLIAGECFLQYPPSNKVIKQFYEKIKLCGFDLVEIDSYAPYHSEFEIGIRQAGFLRPVGLFSTTMSPIIELEERIEYDRNWKRNISKASKQGLKFTCQGTKSSCNFSHLTSSYLDMSARKGFSDALTVDQIKGLLNDPAMVLFTLSNDDNDVIAYRIIHIHNNFATDVLAVNTEPSYEGATHYFLSNIFQYLNGIGVKKFDFARVLYGNKKLDRVAQFKRGVKANYVQYNGEWAWYKYSILRPTMYWVKRILMKRVEV